MEFHVENSKYLPLPSKRYNPKIKKIEVELDAPLPIKREEVKIIQVQGGAADFVFGSEEEEGSAIESEAERSATEEEVEEPVIEEGVVEEFQKVIDKPATPKKEEKKVRKKKEKIVTAEEIIRERDTDLRYIKRSQLEEMIKLTSQLLDINEPYYDEEVSNIDLRRIIIDLRNHVDGDKMNVIGKLFNNILQVPNISVNPGVASYSNKLIKALTNPTEKLPKIEQVKRVFNKAKECLGVSINRHLNSLFRSTYSKYNHVTKVLCEMFDERKEEEYGIAKYITRAKDLLTKALKSGIVNNISKFKKLLRGCVIENIISEAQKLGNISHLDEEDIHLLNDLMKGSTLRLDSDDKLTTILEILKTNGLNPTISTQVISCSNNNSYLLYDIDTYKIIVREVSNYVERNYPMASVPELLKKQLLSKVAKRIDNNIIGQVERKSDEISDSIVDRLYKNYKGDIKLTLRHAMTLAVMFNHADVKNNIATTKTRLLSGFTTAKQVADSPINMCMFPEFMLLDKKKMKLKDAVKSVYKVAGINSKMIRNDTRKNVKLVPVKLPIDTPLKKCQFKGSLLNLLIVPYPDGRIFCFNRDVFTKLIKSGKDNPHTEQPFPKELVKIYNKA